MVRVMVTSGRCWLCTSKLDFRVTVCLLLPQEKYAEANAMFEQVTELIEKTAEIDDLELAYALDVWALTLAAQVIDRTHQFHHLPGVDESTILCSSGTLTMPTLLCDHHSMHPSHHLHRSFLCNRLPSSLLRPFDANLPTSRRTSTPKRRQ